MSTALLVLDTTTSTISQHPTAPQTLLPILSSTISSARSKGVKIIFVHVCFRRNHPEINASNPLFSRLLGTDRYIQGGEGNEIHEALGYDENKGDIVVEKRRISAFVGSDLEVLLRGLGVRKLVVGGLVTSGTVLGTTFDASDRDFEVTVLGDCCMDRDEDLHKITLDKILSKVATVVDSETWLKELS